MTPTKCQEADLAGPLGAQVSGRQPSFLPPFSVLPQSLLPELLVHTLRFLARPSACRVRVQRCTHSEKLRLLRSAL